MKPNQTKKIVATIALEAVILIMTNKTLFWHNLPSELKIRNTRQMTPLKHTLKGENMEKLTSTRNLECYMAKNDQNERQYLIFEKTSPKTPIMACTGKGTLVHLSNTIPLLIEDYKYYKQIEELVKQAILYDRLMGVAK